MPSSKTIIRWFKLSWTSLALFIFLIILSSPPSATANQDSQNAELIYNTWPSATSGARSINPLSGIASLGESFHLLNLFNVFRGQPEAVSTSPATIGTSSQLPSSEDKADNLIQVNTIEPIKDSSSLDWAQTIRGKINSWASKSTDTISTGNANKSKSKIEVPQSTSPVIMIPGYGGSRLEARLSKPAVVRYFCDQKSDWTDIWVNVKLLLPYMIDCLIDDMRLEFDYATNRTHNTAGVEIRVKNESQVFGLEYLHDLPLPNFAYFAPIIGRLVGINLGYERELNILGAPYDFRKAPNELEDYFIDLKETCERTYLKNGRKSVSFICHSMGCNNMLYFLHHQTRTWKQTYVRQLISLAAPWAGSFSAVRAAALGDDLGMPYLFSESKLILVQRSLPSTIYLFPNKIEFLDIPLIRSNTDPNFYSNLSISNNVGDGGIENSSDNIVIMSKKQTNVRAKNFLAHDFKDFFEQINHPDGYRMWLNTKDLLGNLEAPGVEVWCIAGSGLKTLGRMEYAGDFPDSPSEEIYDEGDGTVAIQSAKYCTNWKTEQKQPIHYKEFNVGHMEILKDPQVIDFIEGILNSQ